MKEKGFIKAGICLGCCLSILVTSGCGILPFSCERDREMSEIGIEEMTQTPIPATEVQTTKPETINNSAKLNELGIPNNLKVENNAVVKRGDWGAYYVCDYSTDNYFIAYMQISNVTTASENKAYIDAAIKEYNSEVSSGREISPNNESQNLEYAVADVNLYIPTGQNVKDYIGVPLLHSVSIKGNGDWKDNSGNTYEFKGIKGNGLPETNNERNFYSLISEIMKENQKFSAGDYCQTKIIYSIIKDVATPYSFECSYQAPSNESNYNKITFELKS